MKLSEKAGWLIGIAILLAGCLQSCVSVEKQINKAQLVAVKYPDSFAMFCANAFPVKELVKESIKYIPADNKNYQNKIDSLNDKINDLKAANDKDSTECGKRYQSKINSLVEDINKLKKEPRKPDTVYKEKIVEKENTAKLSALQTRYNDLDNKYAKEKENRLEAENKAEKRLWWLIGLVGVIGLGVFLKIKGILPF